MTQRADSRWRRAVALAVSAVLTLGLLQGCSNDKDDNKNKLPSPPQEEGG